jgi:hypothetical protein
MREAEDLKRRRVLGLVKRLIAAVLLPTAVTASVLAATTSPAAASTGNVTVTVTTTQCPQGGSVATIWFSIDQGGVVNAAAGDTASTWSQLGIRVYITGTAYCKTGWFTGYYSNFYQIPRYFWPDARHTYI